MSFKNDNGIDLVRGGQGRPTARSVDEAPPLVRVSVPHQIKTIGRKAGGELVFELKLNGVVRAETFNETIASATFATAAPTTTLHSCGFGKPLHRWRAA